MWGECMWPHRPPNLKHHQKLLTRVFIGAGGGQWAGGRGGLGIKNSQPGGSGHWGVVGWGGGGPGFRA
jgi:hypothetical protein